MLHLYCWKSWEKKSASLIINDFKATGIYPLDPGRDDYSMCLEIENRDDIDESGGDTSKTTVNDITVNWSANNL